MKLVNLEFQIIKKNSPLKPEDYRNIIPKNVSGNFDKIKVLFCQIFWKKVNV